MNTVISAIVVNYNTGELLRSCVDSLLNCPLEIEIIVVDNASTDGSLDALPGLTREREAKETVAIPIYPELTAGQQSEVVEAVVAFYA